MSYGHDEYLYNVLKQYPIPKEMLGIIRYHSFYPFHSNGAYEYFMNESDELILDWIKQFNRYDLYSKSDGLVDVGAVKDYYIHLIEEFLPSEITW
jgi:inositol oxygenase